MRPGDIYEVPAFYADPLTGELRTKYLLILATNRDGDLVARLLTSRAHGRPERPPCFHGHPYPGFFLGIPGNSLGSPTWVDLRPLSDIERGEFALRIERDVRLAGTISRELLVEAAECVAAADDTTRGQERALRDLLAALRSQESRR
jgi:hypothetical protein